jgi:hypothetical protein
MNFSFSFVDFENPSWPSDVDLQYMKSFKMNTKQSNSMFPGIDGEECSTAQGVRTGFNNGFYYGSAIQEKQHNINSSLFLKSIWEEIPKDSMKRVDEDSDTKGGFDRDRKAHLYKTEKCRSFEETGQCKYGDRCHFAHSDGEMRHIQRHPRYKTEVCRSFWEKGSCPYGKRCCFIHQEIQTAPFSTSTNSNGKEITCKSNNLKQGISRLERLFLLDDGNETNFFRRQR